MRENLRYGVIMDINKFSPTGAIDRKHLISLANVTEDEIYEILYKAKEISTRLLAGEKLTYLKNKYGGFPALQSQYFPLKYCFPYGYNILKYPELKQVMRKLL